MQMMNGSDLASIRHLAPVGTNDVLHRLIVR